MKKVQIFIDSSNEPFEHDMSDSNIEKLMKCVRTSEISGYSIVDSKGRLVLRTEHISAIFIKNEENK